MQLIKYINFIIYTIMILLPTMGFSNEKAFINIINESDDKLFLRLDFKRLNAYFPCSIEINPQESAFVKDLNIESEAFNFFYKSKLSNKAQFNEAYGKYFQLIVPKNYKTSNIVLNSFTKDDASLISEKNKLKNSISQAFENEIRINIRAEDKEILKINLNDIADVSRNYIKNLSLEDGDDKLFVLGLYSNNSYEIFTLMKYDDNIQLSRISKGFSIIVKSKLNNEDNYVDYNLSYIKYTMPQKDGDVIRAFNSISSINAKIEESKRKTPQVIAIKEIEDNKYIFLAIVDTSEELKRNTKIKELSSNTIDEIFKERLRNLSLDKDTAIKIAEAVLVKVYGERVLEQRPWIVKEEDNSFFIKGTFHKKGKGGVAEIEISKTDGSVIRYIHGK